MIKSMTQRQKRNAYDRGVKFELATNKLAQRIQREADERAIENMPTMQSGKKKLLKGAKDSRRIKRASKCKVTGKLSLKNRKITSSELDTMIKFGFSSNTKLIGV
jgi:hypothetical protein